MHARAHRTWDAPLARAGAALALALPLAFAGTAWLQLLHDAEGGTEPGAPGFVAHWLRDATLALPFLLLMVVPMVLGAQSLAARAGVARGRRAGRLVTAGAAAFGAACAFGLGSPVHGALFDASHGGHDLALLPHILRDASLGLAVCLPLAVLCVSLPSRLWHARSLMAAARTCTAVAVAGPMLIIGQAGVQQATAGTSPGSPCPAGTTVKHFEVDAIDVDITLNRFGDHDPGGRMYVLRDQVADVRKQEASAQVSVGLRDDAIQPLVIRANLGDCVEIDFANHATGGDSGVHIDGLQFDTASSGDAIGRNPSSSVPEGGSRTFRYYVPTDRELEGSHYIHPGPGHRQAVSHGLFGALSVQPAGSTYLDPDRGTPLRSGWEAMIKPEGKPAFREYVKLYHEVGDEQAQILDRSGRPLPTVDPITDSYRPGSRAINYRSEPFMNRLRIADAKKSLSYNSYTFGDPATPMMRAYSSDPSKIRILHAGTEMFHVYHLHGGGIRWPQNPFADPGWDYGKVGLNKNPRIGGSSRLDSQSFGPGESYNLEIEGGAGGVQRAVGDLLEHCHIAEHYVSGMWDFWRIFNTRQRDLQPLPDRAAPPSPVDSAGLLGKTMADGTVLTKDNLDEWLGHIIPPRGVPRSSDDGSVWNWALDRSDPEKPLALGEPEETSSWPNLPRTEDGHAAALPGDTFVGDRPKILFDPTTGRPSYPLLRPHIGQRPPQTPDGHTGTPFLGARVDSTPKSAADPWARRADGLCPTNAPDRRFDVTTIQLPIKVTDNGATDPTGKIFVLDEDKADVRAGRKPAQPLALRANRGDCVSIVLTSELEKGSPTLPMPRSNLHIHHVQFDPQGSDGATAGMVYDQSILPYRDVDPQLSAGAAAGATKLQLASVDKFQVGVWIGVGLGEPQPEIRKIVEIDAAASTVTLDQPLTRAHDAGQWAGTEFMQERWYPDVDLDNVFWHDHVDGIHGWGKGLVGQLIVEPPGSTYHDPRTGEEVRSGTIVDIHTDNPLVPGLVNDSFREMALWTIDDNPVTDSTFNLRASPWADRLAKDADPSLLFSSWRHGDPGTPLPEAYTGDPFVLRTINVSGNGVDSLRVAGHRLYTESRLAGPDGKPASTPQDAIQYGISQRFTGILEGGAGGTRSQPGDYLYQNGIGRRFRQGAWGLLRVLGRRTADLQPLPGTAPPQGGTQDKPTGGRPPEATTAGNPCPAAVPKRSFAVSAVDLPVQPLPAGADAHAGGLQAAFVPTDIAADVIAGRKTPEPLVLHAAAGDCIEVKFTNERRPSAVNPELPRASFHVGELAQAEESSGVDAGFNSEQTVVPGKARTSRFYADSEHIDSATIADFGGNDTGTEGLYGAFVIAPSGATFTDPETGAPRDVGAQVDVRLPGGRSYRDAALLLSENDARIGQNTMPYPTLVSGPALVNYRTAPRPDDAMAFSSAAHGDPATPILRAQAGDAVRVHVLGAPGSEQPHAFSFGGLAWANDARLAHSQLVSAAAVTPWAGFDAHFGGDQTGGAGDVWYGDLRRPFSQAGMWGLMRILPSTDCSLKPLRGGRCGLPADPAPAGGGASGGSGSGGGSGGSGSGLGAESRPTAVGDAPSQGAGRAPAAPDRGEDASNGTPSTPSAGSPVKRLRRMAVARTLDLRTLRRTGLRVTVDVGTAPLALELSLVRAGTGRASAARVLARRTVGVRARGAATYTLRLTAAQRRRIRDGRHTVVVRVPGAADRLTQTVQVRARR